MKFGLPNNLTQQIIQVLKNANVSKALIFGSRAMSTWRYNSDIDLAVVGQQLNINRLLSQLDALPSPYLFDVLDYNQITHLALREHIDSVGIPLYDRSNPHAS